MGLACGDRLGKGSREIDGPEVSEKDEDGFELTRCLLDAGRRQETEWPGCSVNQGSQQGEYAE